MVWEVVCAVMATTASVYAQAEQERALKADRPYRHIKVNGPTIGEAAREHRQRMGAMHAETMRGAKVGTFLLMALLVTAAYGLAQLAGIA